MQSTSWQESPAHPESQEQVSGCEQTPLPEQFATVSPELLETLSRFSAAEDDLNDLLFEPLQSHS